MFEKINHDMVAAMKEQNKFTLSVLRMLKSALQMESINKNSDLTDDDVIAVIKKQIKMRNDSVLDYRKYNRMEEVTNLEKEIDILKSYLPEELSEEEVLAKIDEVFLSVKPTSMKDMGTIMKELQCISSRTDMSHVSKMVKDKLMNL